MISIISSFLVGFMLWWIAFGATAFFPQPFDGISDDKLKTYIIVGTALAFICLAIGFWITYSILAVIVGALWGVVFVRSKIRTKD